MEGSELGSDEPEGHVLLDGEARMDSRGACRFTNVSFDVGVSNVVTEASRSYVSETDSGDGVKTGCYREMLACRCDAIIAVITGKRNTVLKLCVCLSACLPACVCGRGEGD